MSDRKQFLLVMLVATLFVVWLVMRGAGVIDLNKSLRDDPRLGSYAYPFRVLRIEGDTAVMTTLRSTGTSTRHALEKLYPVLQSVSESHRDWQRAEREYAQLQARASQIVLAHEKIQRVRWELDEHWYHLQEMRRRQENEAYSAARQGNGE